MRWLIFLLILVAAFSFNACDPAEGQDHNYKVVWDFNNNDPAYLDSTGALWTREYRLYIADNLDASTDTPFIEFQSGLPDASYLIGVFNHDSLFAVQPDSVMVLYPSAKNSKYMSAIVFATGINTDLVEVHSSGSNVFTFKKADDRVPDTPDALRIKQ